MTTFVLVTEGKGNSQPDYATVKQYESYDRAYDFVTDTNANSVGKKYWTRAEIVEINERVQLDSPGY